jgi:type III pantothenate kinase
MKWLVLDVGNGAAKGALVDSTGTIATAFRQPYHSGWVEELVGRCPADIERVGMVSVHPGRSNELLAHLPRIETFDAYSALPIRVGYQTPETLGADRIAAAVGGWLVAAREESAERVIVIDAGTAVTFEIIDSPGIYLGGTIAPGPHLMREALQRGTAQLPAVELTLPDEPIGRTTFGALQSGILNAFIGGVLFTLEQLRLEGREDCVLLTGGWSDLLRDHLPDGTRHRPHLVLEGVIAMMQMGASHLR